MRSPCGLPFGCNRSLEMFVYLLTLLQLKADRRGVTALEYGLIAGLIAVVIISAVTLVGADLKSMFTKISTGLGP